MKFSLRDVSNLGTILTVWAHPDDEAWCAAGLLAAAVTNGQRVVCVTATVGDAGKTADENKWPQDNLGKIRADELQAAVEIIGIREHHLLDYADGQLDTVDVNTASQQIARFISEVKPDTIITFGADGLTGHADHVAVFEWVKQAVMQGGSQTQIYCATETTERYEHPATRACDQKFNIYFATDKPKTVAKADADICFELTPDLQTKKLACLQAHASQTTNLFNDPDGQEFLKQLASCECFVKLNKRIESTVIY